VALDIYRTILHSRGRSGLITEALTRTVWRLVRGVAFRRSRLGRHRLLNHIGPLLLPGIVTTLVALLILGYALVYWPHLPADFNVQEKAQSPRTIEALYFSGIIFTTLGYGDIAPRSTSMRLLDSCLKNHRHNWLKICRQQYQAASRRLTMSWMARSAL